MSRLTILARKDLLEQWRTLRLPIVAIIFFVFGLLSPVLAKYTPQIVEHAGGNIKIDVPTPTTMDAVDQFIKNVGQVGSFAAILLGMSTVARERERGTAALVLSKPVSRPAFLGSKFASFVVTLLVGVVVADLADYAYTAALFEAMNIAGFVACCALIFVGIAVYGAVTFFASTLIGSTLPAAGVGLGAYILTAVIGIDQTIGHVMPGGLESPAKALALGASAPHLWTSLGFNLLWIVLLLAASWVVFRNQEFGS